MLPEEAIRALINRVKTVANRSHNGDALITAYDDAFIALCERALLDAAPTLPTGEKPDVAGRSMYHDSDPCPDTEPRPDTV
jgi:hypothetical protein